MTIGIFDSGIGGATVLKHLLTLRPHDTYLYYADNLHAPYGERSASEIYDLTCRALTELFEAQCQLVVLACNTATTVLPRIQHEWLPYRYPDRRVLGVIRPTVEHMMSLESRGRIYLMATTATVNSRSYEHELTKLSSDIDLVTIACPDLALAIERSDDLAQDSHIDTLIARYLAHTPHGIHTQLYTGCTHYELIRDRITDLTGIKAYTQGYLCAHSLIDYLERHGDAHPQTGGSLTIMSTGPDHERYHTRLMSIMRDAS